MAVNNMFDYLEKLPRKDLNALLEEIEKLNYGKLSYSVQEVQSMDILADERDNLRILGETEEFLGLCNEFFYKNRTGTTIARDIASGYIKKREYGENIDIDLSDLKGKIFTLADLSFKANKFTKKLCESAIQRITGENNITKQVKYPELKAVIKELHEIYRNSNHETEGRKTVEEQLNQLEKNLKSENNTKWRSNINSGIPDREALELLFNDLCPIWHVEDVLYEIKNQLNTQLIRCLIKDNYTEFRNWGFVNDNGMLVLNLDSRQVVERYGYHIPAKDKVLSEELIDALDNQNLQFKLDFTSIVRKNNLDRVLIGNGEEVTTNYKTRMIRLLKNVDLENYTENDYGKVNELYELGKFMNDETYNNIIKENPSLKKQCDLLKELVNPSKDKTENLSGLHVNEYYTKYEKYIKSKIENALNRNGASIYIQGGNNLDIQASIYALRRHMRDICKKTDLIEVKRINAGEQIDGKGLIIDAGKLEGIESITKKIKKDGKEKTFPVLRAINANTSRAQKSTCGVLSQYGIYVPEKIVQYADTVPDETVLLPRYGVNVSRYLTGKKLFDFAEAKREDGTYLFEAELTDEELKKYSTEPKKGKDNGTDLIEMCNRRQEQIEKDMKEISKNIYKITTKEGDKYVAVVNHYINCGSFISYALGCDYYVSVADEKAEYDNSNLDFFTESHDRATFGVCANPKSGEGVLPEELLEWCKELRDNGENDTFKMYTVSRDKNDKVQRKKGEEEIKPFIKPTKDMVVFGGQKTSHLFVAYKGELPREKTLKDKLIESLLHKLGGNEIEKMSEADSLKIVKNSMNNYKNNEAKKFLNQVLFDAELISSAGAEQISIDDTEYNVKKIKNIAKEKGGTEHDNNITR